MFEPTDDRRPFALVVDDDVLLLMHASEILNEAGFRPLEAVDVDAAELLLIDYADEIILLFTDVQMPGSRDGFALARMTAERWPEIGTIVASGLANPDPGLMPDGAIFLRKPFHADLIYDRLQTLLPDGKKPDMLKQRTVSTRKRASKIATIGPELETNALLQIFNLCWAGN